MSRYEWGEPTYEEALDTINRNIMNLSCVEASDAVEKAIQTLEEASKYKWHDLKKNPTDLPPYANELCVYAIPYGNGSFGYIMAHCDQLRAELGYPSNLNVSAWKLIEPFESEESNNAD